MLTCTRRSTAKQPQQRGYLLMVSGSNLEQLWGPLSTSLGSTGVIIPSTAASFFANIERGVRHAAKRQAVVLEVPSSIPMPLVEQLVNLMRASKVPVSTLVLGDLRTTEEALAGSELTSMTIKQGVEGAISMPIPNPCKGDTTITFPMTLKFAGPAAVPTRQVYRQPTFLPNGISKELVASIKAGNCVVFLGAGWDAAASFPSWTKLLNLIIDDSASAKKLTAEQVSSLKGLITGSPSSSALDQCAQELEDILTLPVLVEVMKKFLSVPKPLPELMQKRMNILKRLKFRGIVTTNYTAICPGRTPNDPACPYRQILRPKDCADDPPYRNGLPATIQVHGNFTDPNSIVLTRMGYRNLLYHVPEYVTFLRSMVATTTILYLGFSFSDAYINEVRSEIVSMLDDAGETVRPPMGYALVANMPKATADFFLRHEGVHVTAWDTAKEGWGYFETWLEKLLAAVEKK